jgi:hypothetical protein
MYNYPRSGKDHRAKLLRTRLLMHRERFADVTRFELARWGNRM